MRTKELELLFGDFSFVKSLTIKKIIITIGVRKAERTTNPKIRLEFIKVFFINGSPH
tara:strand:+ start:822 stop:992 length:171 start_codon:yes stop_codon:yes gene_type:complete